MWYTPAHILGGWRAKLRKRRQADALREVLALERTSVRPESGAEPVRDGELLLVEDVVAVSAVEEPAAEMQTSDDALCDLFDAAVAESKASIFDAVDQLALF